MAIAHSVWSLSSKSPLQITSLTSEKELEDLISENIAVLNDEWLIIGRQVKTIANGFIDLLCLDRSGDTIVVELKREMTPREVTAQAIDYAACIANFTSSDLAKFI